MAGTMNGAAPVARTASTTARNTAAIVLMPRLPAVTAICCPGRSLLSKPESASRRCTSPATSAICGASQRCRSQVHGRQRRVEIISTEIEFHY